MDRADNGHGNVVEYAERNDGVSKRSRAALVSVIAAAMVMAFALLAAISLAALSSSPALAATPSASSSSSVSSSASSSAAASSSGSSSARISDAITDTQNLLGGDLSSVTDAIAHTKKETGVTVRLLYLAQFEAGKNPDTWTSQLLESLNPQPNTVMLAVASQDGNLVVAVSSNSDEWLRKQSTVDDLSKAALHPIVADSTPDWAASAKDMMNAIVQEKKTSTTTSTVWVGVGIFAAVLLLLAIITVAVTIMRRRHAGKEPSGRTHSHRGERKNTGVSLKKTSRSRHARHGGNSAESESKHNGTNNAESSQETSSL